MRKLLLCSVLLICGLAVLSACSEKRNSEPYGVSVSAPSLASLSDSSHFADYLPLFGMSNGLGCDILSSSALNDSFAVSFAYSSLFICRDLYLTGTNREYVNRIAALSGINDTSEALMCEKFETILNNLFSVDSTLQIVSFLDSSQTDIKRFVQRIEVPLFHEDALQTLKSDFYDEDSIVGNFEFYKLSGSFACLISEYEAAIDIPVGNGTYSLLLIMPLQQPLRRYVAMFSEKKYAEVVKGLEKRNICVCFPTFDTLESDMKFSLPYADDSLSSEVRTYCSFNIRKPKEAELQSYKRTLSERMERDNCGEYLSFDHSMIFMLRETSSRAVLLQGVFLR